MFKWLGKLVDSNDKALERLQPLVHQINELEEGHPAPGIERHN